MLVARIIKIDQEMNDNIEKFLSSTSLEVSDFMND